MILGIVTSLLLPVCCLLTMGGAPPRPQLPPAGAGLRPVIAAHSQQTSSVSPAHNVLADSATIRSLPPLPRDLIMRRNVRNQTAHRVRRAKKSYRAAGPLLRRSSLSSTKPPERAALLLLSMRSGRSPPSA